MTSFLTHGLNISLESFDFLKKVQMIIKSTDQKTPPGQHA